MFVLSLPCSWAMPRPTSQWRPRPCPAGCPAFWPMEGWTPASGDNTRSGQLEQLICASLVCLLERYAHAQTGLYAPLHIKLFMSVTFEFWLLNNKRMDVASFILSYAGVKSCGAYFILLEEYCKSWGKIVGLWCKSRLFRRSIMWRFGLYGVKWEIKQMKC